MSRFIALDRDTAYLMPPSVDEWLPQDHLARFVVEVIDQLNLSDLTRQYAGRGSDAYHPGMLLGSLAYGYAAGVHWSALRLRTGTRRTARPGFRGVPGGAEHARRRSRAPPALSARPATTRTSPAWPTCPGMRSPPHASTRKPVRCAFRPISDEAPQSIKKSTLLQVTWKHVLSRPPLPNASPLPMNRSSMAVEAK